MENKEKNIPELICLVIGASISSLILLIFGCFVFKTLWNWYIPGIFGLKKICIIEALGIDLIFTYMSSHCRNKRKEIKNWEDLIVLFGEITFYGFGVLFVGYIGTLFL